MEAFPLDWPLGYKRTKYPTRSRFKGNTFGRCRDFIINEIKRFNGNNVIISTNIPLRNDGLPYATFKTPEDKGVAVFFEINKKQYVFCCDKWDRIEDNLHAIGMTIEAMRGIDRWGVSEMIERSFSGFAALPEPTQARKDWWDVLSIKSNAGISDIKQAYRDKVKLVHPDSGGSNEEFIELQQAYERAIKSIPL